MTKEEINETELKPCPQCGEIPMLGYACGEYFIFHPSKCVGTCFCSSFCEMHSSKKLEIEAWNRRADNEQSDKNDL